MQILHDFMEAEARVITVEQKSALKNISSDYFEYLSSK